MVYIYVDVWQELSAKHLSLRIITGKVFLLFNNLL